MHYRVFDVTFLRFFFKKKKKILHGSFSRIFSLVKSGFIYFLFSAGAMRSHLRVAGIRQDRDVYVDVHRGSVSAQHGDW